MQTNTNQVKATPHQQAIKAGANPDVIAERVIQLLDELDNDSYVDLEDITAETTAIQTAILTAIARRIDKAGLYPECAIYYGGELLDRSGITQEDLDANSELKAALKNAIAHEH